MSRDIVSDIEQEQISDVDISSLGQTPQLVSVWRRRRESSSFPKISASLIFFAEHRLDFFHRLLQLCLVFRSDLLPSVFRVLIQVDHLHGCWPAVGHHDTLCRPAALLRSHFYNRPSRRSRRNRDYVHACNSLEQPRSFQNPQVNHGRDHKSSRGDDYAAQRRSTPCNLLHAPAPPTFIICACVVAICSTWPRECTI